MKKKNKAYWEMPSAELRQATREFDREGIAESFGAPTAAARRVLRRAAKRGRPRVGQGAEKIRVSVERGLLAQADLVAEALHVSRSELIARGLRAVLAVQTH
ncbi:MAG: hypothetical protein WCI73_01460 [Phycisphaerae bacterium]